MKVFVSGGGTGGHFFPALALLECLLEKNLDAVFVGSNRGIEYRLRNTLPVESLFVASHPFAGKGLQDKFLALFKVIMGGISVAKKLKKGSACVIFGGYASVPLGLASLLKMSPLYLHEQNSIPSLTNRFFSRFSKKIFITFEHSRKYFPLEKTVKTGIPVRKKLIDGLKVSREDALKSLGLEDRPTLLVMGGSQGASFLNEVAKQIFLKTDWQGIHITGEKEYEGISYFYKEKGLKVIALPFTQDMHIIYRSSSVAISRAGASSITELSLYGIPTLFIPFPHATKDHQFYNAKEIEDLGGGLVIRQEKASSEELINKLEKLISQHKIFSQNIKAFSNPLACEEMLKYILSEEGR